MHYIDSHLLLLAYSLRLKEWYGTCSVEVYPNTS